MYDKMRKSLDCAIGTRGISPSFFVYLSLFHFSHTVYDGMWTSLDVVVEMATCISSENRIMFSCTSGGSLIEKTKKKNYHPPRKD